MFSRPSHKLYGQRYVNRILVLLGQGGRASAWMLRELVRSGISPKALVFNMVNPILAQGAAFAELPLVDRFEDGDVTALFRIGEELLIEPQLGSVTILDRA